MAAASDEGIWRLPPQQRILQRSESSFDLHRVSEELTVIMSTSVGDFTPSTGPVIAALESLQANVALRWCRKILVFDKVPSQEEIEELKKDPKLFHYVARGGKWQNMWNQKREDYEEYCATLRAMKEADHPALFNTDLIFLEKFGHLFGTVKRAFEHLMTRFVFLTQHDLRLGGHFIAADVQVILEALDGGEVKYVVLNRDVNSSVRTKAYFRLIPEKSVDSEENEQTSFGLNLTAMAGYSDQAHFAETAWYRREVCEAIRPDQQLTCMEHVLHDRWKDSDIWKSTFLYGGLDMGPFVFDLVYGAQAYDKREGKLRKFPPPPTRQPV